MKKFNILLVLMFVLVVMVSCVEREGEIISSSEYVTPTMMQKLQDSLDEMPEPQKDETDVDANALQSESSVGENDESAKNDIAQSMDAGTEKLTDGSADTAQTQDKSETVSKQEKSVSQQKPKTSTKTNVNTVGDETVVYVSKSGKKFHKTPTCSNMTSPIQMTRSEAENSGRTYCKKCYK